MNVSKYWLCLAVYVRGLICVRRGGNIDFICVLELFFRMAIKFIHLNLMMVQKWERLQKEREYIVILASNPMFRSHFSKLEWILLFSSFFFQTTFFSSQIVYVFDDHCIHVRYKCSAWRATEKKKVADDGEILYIWTHVSPCSTLRLSSCVCVWVCVQQGITNPCNSIQW